MNSFLRSINIFALFGINPFRSVKSRFILQSMAGRLEWRMFLSLYGLHIATSYLGLYLSDEVITERFVEFFYFYITTLSTVGYGDLSPTTDMGRVINSVFIIPVGVVLFSALVGEVIQKYMNINDDLRNGKINFMNSKGHIVIFGNTLQAERLVEQIRLEPSAKMKNIALVLPDADNYPDMTNSAYIVAVKSFLDQCELERLSLCDASSILIDTGDDGTNIAVCMLVQHLMTNICNKLKPNIIAFFEDGKKEGIVESSCPDIECLTYARNSVLARAVTDAGAIKVNESINSPVIGSATQYSKCLPESLTDSTYGDIKNKLEEALNITMIGIEVTCENGRREALLNPSRDSKITGGQRFFYISSDRLVAEDVQGVLKEAA
jgi:voltage-gated potassium channel